jgi:hypothetical protein
MPNTLKRLVAGTRALESRLTASFEAAAQTFVGPPGSVPPLEVIGRAVDEIASHVIPAGRGRYAFPFNSVTITFAAETPEQQARFEAIAAGPPSITDRVLHRLASAGCDSPSVDVHLEFAEELPTPFQISLARVSDEARDPIGPALAVDLEVTCGTTARPAYSFTSLPIAIGRGSNVRDNRQLLLRINDIAFDEADSDVNRTVSRRHARIVLDERTGRPRLLDDNSAQGTSVIRGGRGIAVPRGSRGLGLESGDEIVLGQARLTIRITRATRT